MTYMSNHTNPTTTTTKDHAERRAYRLADWLNDMEGVEAYVLLDNEGIVCVQWNTGTDTHFTSAHSGMVMFARRSANRSRFIMASGYGFTRSTDCWADKGATIRDARFMISAITGTWSTEDVPLY